MSGVLKIVGKTLPNVPWQDRPAECTDVLWRYAENPIIPQDLIPCANSIFNNGVPYQGEFEVFPSNNKAGKCASTREKCRWVELGDRHRLSLSATI